MKTILPIEPFRQYVEARWYAERSVPRHSQVEIFCWWIGGINLIICYLYVYVDMNYTDLYVFICLYEFYLYLQFRYTCIYIYIYTHIHTHTILIHFHVYVGFSYPHMFIFIFTCLYTEEGTYFLFSRVETTSCKIHGHSLSPIWVSLKFST